MVDEAHLLTHEQLEDLPMLTSPDMDSRSPAAIVLIGQPTLRRSSTSCSTQRGRRPLVSSAHGAVALVAWSARRIEAAALAGVLAPAGLLVSPGYRMKLVRGKVATRA